MAGQDEALANLATLLRQRPPTADEQGSPEEEGLPGKLVAQRRAMGSLTKEGSTLGEKPDYEHTLRIMDALTPGELGSQRGEGMLPIPKNMVLPEYIKKQMPIGLLRSKLKEGDLERKVDWLDPENPEHQKLYADHMTGGTTITASKPKAPARK